MKILFLTLLTALMALPAFAADNPSDAGWLKLVEPKKVCMVNNMFFDKDQIAVEVAGKTYYGCCPMCKGMLENDAAQRSAIDPVSGKAVDKASAIIGADSDGNAYYFESQNNLKKFSSGPKPDKKPDAGMSGMSMPMQGMKGDMMIGDQSGQEKALPTVPASQDDKGHQQHH